MLPVTSPLDRSAKLTGLLPLTEYRVSARFSLRCQVWPVITLHGHESANVLTKDHMSHHVYSFYLQ